MNEADYHKVNHLSFTAIKTQFFIGQKYMQEFMDTYVTIIKFAVIRNLLKPVT